MPLYTFKNKETNEVKEQTIAMSEYDSFLSNNPHLERVYEKMNIVSGFGSIHRYTDEGWKDRLRSIKKANPGSSINV